MAKQRPFKGQSDPLDQPLKETDRVLADKAYAEVAALCLKYDLELDTDTGAIVQYICTQGAILKNAQKILTKDWATCTILAFWYNCKMPATKQRAFEFLCDMLGHTPQYGSRSTGQLLDITYKAVDRLPVSN